MRLNFGMLPIEDNNMLSVFGKLLQEHYQIQLNSEGSLQNTTKSNRNLKANPRTPPAVFWIPKVTEITRPDLIEFRRLLK